MTYGIIIWGSAYSNVLEPLNVVHRTLLRQDYIEGNCTNDLYKKLRILNIQQLHNKVSTTKIYMLKIQIILHRKNRFIITRNMINGNLILFKPNTIMIKMFYVGE